MVVPFHTLTGEIARRLAALLIALALVGGLAAPAAAQEATPGAGTPSAGTPAASVVGLGGVDLAAAAAGLIAVQDAGGGFIGFSGDADPGVTTDAVMALVAAEEAGVDVGDSIDLALGYLESEGAAYAEIGIGQAAKLVLAVVAAGADPAAFGGTDLVEAIEGIEIVDGVIGTGYFDAAYVTLAAAALESERTSEFSDALLAGQLEDGSWAYSPGAAVGDGDSNTTALALQAIVATGNAEDPAIEAGLAYLATVRAENGGYGYAAVTDVPTVADANSTALVIQALIATSTPVDDAGFQADTEALAAFQLESGQFAYLLDDPTDNLFATVQAIPAAAGLPLPVAA
ncbi:MAG TPA: hypothetical protein VGT61_07995 [Thermomicrobiales bacterium]|jgi:hypothetical protein|nr:hypothetical protein [Thermomicrobiales bacterium]